MVPGTATQIQPPEKFSFQPEDWQSWIQHFKCFRIASDLHDGCRR